MVCSAVGQSPVASAWTSAAWLAGQGALDDWIELSFRFVFSVYAGEAPQSLAGTARLVFLGSWHWLTLLGLAGLAGIGVGLAFAYLALSLTERGPGRELREQLFRSTLVDPSISVIGSALVAGVLLVFALRGLLAPPAEPELQPRP